MRVAFASSGAIALAQGELVICALPHRLEPEASGTLLADAHWGCNMDDADFGFLLDTACARWRACLDAHAEVAIRLAGGASIPKREVARVRAELDSALHDFMSLRAQADDPVQASGPPGLSTVLSEAKGEDTSWPSAAAAVRPRSVRGSHAS